MTKTLFGFGFNGHAQLQDPSASGDSTGPKADIVHPTPLLQNESVEVLWSSWCDSLVSVASSKVATSNCLREIRYAGPGLAKGQLDALKSIRVGDPVQFFGSTLVDGVRGFIRGQDPSTIIIFALDSEIESSKPEVETYYQPGNERVQNILFGSGGDITAITKHVDSCDTTASDPDATIVNVIKFDSLVEFRQWLGSSQAPFTTKKGLTLPCPGFKSVVNNATTITALTTTGIVYTWSSDSRYPKCLGRPNAVESPDNSSAMDIKPDVNTNIPTPVPFLSETKIVKIASGGYMTAALSEDGELFLWGQACPGAEGELDLFGPPKAIGIRGYSEKDMAILQGESNWPMQLDDPQNVELDDEDQDEIVKCVNMSILGEHARVLDVAVGFGHVLVAAEMEVNNNVFSGIFAAGQVERGQSGMGPGVKFLEQFTRVPFPQDLKVTGVAAAGWTSWAIAERMFAPHTSA